MLERRPAVGWENFFINTKTYVQLALTLEDKSAMPKILNKMNKAVAALHHGTDGKDIFKTNGPTPIFNLPDNIKDLDVLNNIMYQKYTRPMDQALASIGTNSDTIILNINHLACDGGYIHNLFEYLKKDEEIDYVPSIIPVEKVFDEEIQKYNGEIPKYAVEDPKVTRIYPKDATNFHTTYGMLTNTVSSDAKDLMTYKLNGKIKNLTEYYWSSVILSVSAFNGKLETTGLPTCINMRQMLSKESFSYANCFSHVYVHADVTKDDTVDTLMKRLRNDFNFNFNRKIQVGELKAMKLGWTTNSNLPGMVPDLSLNGTFTINGPFKDMWLGLDSVDGGRANIICFIAFSKVKGDKNTVYGRLRHAPGDISDNESKTLLSSFHYGLENMSPNMKIAEAMDMLKDYQMSFRKKLPATTKSIL